MSYQNFSREQMQAMDAAHHLHPFTDHADLRAAGSRIITRADGPYVYDALGNEILDAMAGLWCVNAGYGRKELVDAATAQLEELPYYNSFFRCTTPTPALLADRLARIAPDHINQVFFGSSGSEANDTALRLVRHYWALEGRPEKNIVISRDWAYHGSTIAATSLGGMAAMHEQLYGAVPNIRHVMCPYAFELAEPGESDHDFGLRAAKAVEDAIVEAGPDNVAAFIGEPIQGAGGVKIPPASYWPEIQRICDRYDVLLMLDEVITGYGRTGEWFAAQSMDIAPDTITTAKGLTSGYQPLSALLVGDRIAKTLVDKGGEFYHGYTYSGHPVACAVALANLEIIEREGLIDRVREDTGPYLGEALTAGIGDHPLVGEVRTFGLLAGIEIVKDRDTRARFEPEGHAASVVRDHAIEGGLMMRAVMDTMILSPPLIWTRETIDTAVDRIRAALDKAAKDLR
ncbi:MAG: aspartate aminotransferase family protein [Roseitalea sp.]|jgi:putrescine aminotransferase|uniref:Aspartate aminotransferase family protein n=1 Tax=Oceaniradius stylonematis TaxID=2184161 RepID=A0A3A8AGA5_9HYPH|nr:aspartate aminotransferase family protein [Oceaniradius stylonematis]MBO6551381.1 aspartate aminotransferase family protein [Roseitalea sp.]MBO6952239.1 aspartate aminotransferase family protein [Rhizobiaceae bacterium]RNC90732.1 MAG: aspartate aminotransferase family protein [Oricola sp.]MBO6591915.1 aspartate aminotransferase family protein [Roseitalea sp.]MBO6598170.1 aspartate aminotransferase family protein [Roseitalea sp.]